MTPYFTYLLFLEGAEKNKIKRKRKKKAVTSPPAHKCNQFFYILPLPVQSDSLGPAGANLKQKQLLGLYTGFYITQNSQLVPHFPRNLSPNYHLLCFLWIPGFQHSEKEPENPVMVSTKQLLSTIESALLGPSPPSPAQRIELIHAIHNALSSFKSLLSYPVCFLFFPFAFLHLEKKKVSVIFYFCFTFLASKTVWQSTSTIERSQASGFTAYFARWSRCSDCKLCYRV